MIIMDAVEGYLLMHFSTFMIMVSFLKKITLILVRIQLANLIRIKFLELILAHLILLKVMKLK